MSHSRQLKRLMEYGPKKAKVLSTRELKKLLFVVSLTRNPERNTLIVWLLFGAGLRVTEVASIRIEDVLWPSGKIRTEVRIPAAYTKNSEAGHVFFYNSNLICALEAYIALRQQKRLRVTPNSSTYRGLQPHSQLILSENGTGYSLKRKKRINAEGETVEYSAADTLQSMISSWGKEAGIPNFASHSGRRTFAMRLANTKSVDEDQLRSLMRHSSNDMLYEYVEVDLARMQKTIERMFSET